MNFSNTFTPYKIGNLMIKNRLTVPAMDSGVFSPEGYVAQSTLDYYGARAAGGFGLIIIEIAAVEKRGVGMPHEPNVWSDDAIEGLTKLANCIKNKGARTIVQLHQARWRESRSPPLPACHVRRTERLPMNSPHRKCMT